MLVISTTNDTGLTLYAFIEKVTIAGAFLDPRIAWNWRDEEFQDNDLIPDQSDALVELEEQEDLVGFYKLEISGIDGASENLQITIHQDSITGIKAIGILTSLPGELEVPVTLNFEVTEDRNS